MANSADLVIGALSIAALMILLSSFIVFFILRYRQKQTEFEKEKIQLKLELEGELTKAQLEISEDLMKRISLEIHDNVGASLSLAKLQLHSLTNENFNDNAERSRELITRAIQDLRNLSKSLNGNFILVIGLEEAIARETELINASGEITCSYEGTIDGFGMNEQHEVILFRCIQEALNNCVKHAEAKNIRVEATLTEEKLLLQVKDDGKGMDLSVQNANGLGMKSLQQRARVMGGNCIYESVQGRGTTVKFEIPLINIFMPSGN